jgi:uncharacterized protein (DUF1330 family)
MGRLEREEGALAAYVIVDVTVTDPEAYKEYTAQTPGSIARYGGKFIVRGGAYETLEGEWNPQRIVVVEFPSMEQARAWYYGDEYQAILPIRQRNSTARFFTMVEGAADPS